MEISANQKLSRPLAIIIVPVSLFHSRLLGEQFSVDALISGAIIDVRSRIKRRADNRMVRNLSTASQQDPSTGLRFTGKIHSTRFPLFTFKCVRRRGPSRNLLLFSFLLLRTRYVVNTCLKFYYKTKSSSPQSILIVELHSILRSRTPVKNVHFFPGNQYFVDFWFWNNFL